MVLSNKKDNASLLVKLGQTAHFEEKMENMNENYKIDANSLTIHEFDTFSFGPLSRLGMASNLKSSPPPHPLSFLPSHRFYMLSSIHRPHGNTNICF